MLETFQIPFANDGKIKEKSLMIQKWKKLITKKRYSKLTKNSNIKIKQKSDGKIYLFSRCIDVVLKCLKLLLKKDWMVY